jgi:hypothetical protein
MNQELLRIAHRIFSCALVLLLAACASQRIEPPQTLKPDQGAFVVKITTDPDFKYSGVYTTQWIEMQRVDEPDSGEFIAARAQWDASSPESMVFSGTLKPGRYQLVRAGGAEMAKISVPLQLYGTFEVRAGQVSVLGTLILRPLKETRRLLGVFAVGYGYAQPDGAMLQSMQHYFPALGKQMEGRAVNGFPLTLELNRAADQALQYKQRSQFLTGVWQDERGSIYTTWSMGTVALKKAGQQGWRELDVGSWRSVTSFKPYRSGLVIGGDEGLFKFSSDDGKTWSDLPLPAWGQVAHIEVMQNDRMVVLVRKGSSWTVCVTNDALAGNWQILATVQIRSATPSRILPFVPSYSRQGNNLVILAHGQDKVHILDLNNGNVDAIPNPLPTLFAVNAQTNGSLVIRGTTFKPSALYSEDGGRSWRELKRRGFVAFKDSSTLYSVYDTDVAYSRDGGNKWVQLNRPPWQEDDVREFLIDRSDQSLLVFLYDGSIHRSRDEGATWTKER